VDEPSSISSLRFTLTLQAFLLLAVALRQIGVLHGSQDFQGTSEHAPIERLTVCPETAGWTSLSWIPGVGDALAKQMVLERSYLGVPLGPQQLPLFSGIGSVTAQNMPAWVVGPPR
jgi:hypothetical protein